MLTEECGMKAPQPCCAKHGIGGFGVPAPTWHRDDIWHFTENKEDDELLHELRQWFAALQYDKIVCSLLSILEDFPKASYLHLLLTLNEDFDDDLLQDAIDLLNRNE